MSKRKRNTPANGDKYAVLHTWPIANWAWPKVVLFVPMIPALPYADDVFFHFMDIASGGVPFFKLPYAIPDMARNKAGKALLDSEFTHVLMLDADHQHPHDIVQRLARRVIENPERLVVAALAFRRGEPYDPMMWIRRDGVNYTVHEWEPNSCFEVDFIATPAMLIHRSVFEKVQPPWFWYDYSEQHPDMGRRTEDIGFCRKVKDAGIKIYCDTSVITPHMRSVTVDENTYRTWCAMHPESLADPIIEKKADAISKRLGISHEELERRVNRGGLNVREAWADCDPQSPEEVAEFYGHPDNGYFYDLLAWNRTPLYRAIVKPLHQVYNKKVLIVGAGIGGEVDALLDRGNEIAILDVPGDLRDFVIEYYGDKISAKVSWPYDLIVAVDVIEHIHPAELEVFLDDLSHRLAAGGVLYCHNNFAQQDLYPMHYAENEQVFDAWVRLHFDQAGEGIYRRKELVKA